MPQFTNAKLLHFSETHYKSIALCISEDKELISGGARSTCVAQRKHKGVSIFEGKYSFPNDIIFRECRGKLDLVYIAEEKLSLI